MERIRRLWVSCDEAGTHPKAAYYGFGSLWMVDQKRGEFSKLVRDIRVKHGLQPEGEFKWTKVSAAKLGFYRDMVEAFFRTTWLAFHCIVVEKKWIDLSQSDGDLEEAMMKHLHTFIVNKVGRCTRKSPGQIHRFRFWVDPLPVSYKKADEKVMALANNALRQVLGDKVIEVLVPTNSKEAPSIQLCDLLLGAVVDAWNQDAVAPHKTSLAKDVASYLGWPDLRAPTFAGQRKFNVWFLQDPKARLQSARPVTLRWPLPGNVKGAI